MCGAWTDPHLLAICALQLDVANYPWNDGWPADALEATKQPYEETTREEMLVKFCACIRCAFLPSAYSNKTVVDGPRFDGKQCEPKLRPNCTELCTCPPTNPPQPVPSCSVEEEECNHMYPDGIAMWTPDATIPQRWQCDWAAGNWTEPIPELTYQEFINQLAILVCNVSEPTWNMSQWDGEVVDDEWEGGGPGLSLKLEDGRGHDDEKTVFDNDCPSFMDEALARYYFCNDVQNQLVECNSSGLNSIYENTTWPNGTWVTVMHPLAGPPTIDEWLVDVFIEGEVADFMLDAAAQELLRVRFAVFTGVPYDDITITAMRAASVDITFGVAGRSGPRAADAVASATLEEMSRQLHQTVLYVGVRQPTTDHLSGLVGDGIISARLWTVLLSVMALVLLLMWCAYRWGQAQVTAATQPPKPSRLHEAREDDEVGEDARPRTSGTGGRRGRAKGGSEARTSRAGKVAAGKGTAEGQARGRSRGRFKSLKEEEEAVQMQAPPPCPVLDPVTQTYRAAVRTQPPPPSPPPAKSDSVRPSPPTLDPDTPPAKAKTPRAAAKTPPPAKSAAAKTPARAPAPPAPPPATIYDAAAGKWSDTCSHEGSESDGAKDDFDCALRKQVHAIRKPIGASSDLPQELVGSVSLAEWEGSAWI